MLNPTTFPRPSEMRRRAVLSNGRRSAPGVQMLHGGYHGQEQIHFGHTAPRPPVKNVAERTNQVIRRLIAERTAGETFRILLNPIGGERECAC